MIVSKVNGRVYKGLKIFTREFVEKLKDGQKFSVRDIACKYNIYAWNIGREKRLPFDDTIGRMLREIRQNDNTVNYFDRSISVWWKKDREGTQEEKQLYKKKRHLL